MVHNTNKSQHAETLPEEDELPSYEDVIKDEEHHTQYTGTPYGQQSRPSHSTTQSNNNHRPQAPPIPPHPAPRPQSKPNNTQSKIPWTYPRGYYCPKCANTGFKLKNGKSCKTCWRKFSPSNNVNMIPSGYNYYQSSPIYPSYGQMSPPMQMVQQQQQRPLYVKPGDPRIGGVLCGNCRGTGRIRFILDEDICTLCNGLGRIIHRR